MFVRTAGAIVLCVTAMAGQVSTTELRLRVDPESRKIRPNESAVIQVQVFGAVGDRKGRLQRDGATVRIVEQEGGWISKPFRYQGADTAEYLQTRSSAFEQLLGRNVGQYTVKDALLYTAPEKAGKYTVVVELEGKQAETMIEVAADAPSARSEEKQEFSSDPAAEDPYRKLAEHYAPFIAQETWFQPKADFLARFDYDGDWNGSNNWDNLEQGSSQAYVYYDAVETPTHVFLHYNFFHPRDYSDNCVVGSCHENDNEGIILTIQKDGSEFGRLQVLQALAHNMVHSYANDGSLRPGLHDIEGAVAFWQDSHPMVFLEAGGHGAYAANDNRSLFSVSRMQFAGAGVTYIFKGEAERPRAAVDREVGYDLLPIREHLWRKSVSKEWQEPTFDDYYEYVPFGGRPRMKDPRISGAFLGRVQAENKARPFWGWFDDRARKAGVIATGQWGLDPAYSVSKFLSIPKEQKFSLDYTYNPYLDIETETTRASMAAPEGFVAATPMQSSAPVRAASAAGASTGSVREMAGAALGQVLAGGNQGAFGSVIQRAGIGAGGLEALKGVAGSVGVVVPTSGGECSLRVSVTSAGQVTVRADKAEGSDGVTPALKCAAPLPQAASTIRLETRRGPAAASLIEQPAAGNEFAAKLRFEKPGEYTVILRW